MNYFTCFTINISVYQCSLSYGRIWTHNYIRINGAKTKAKVDGMECISRLRKISTTLYESRIVRPPLISYTCFFFLQNFHIIKWFLGRKKNELNKWHYKYIEKNIGTIVQDLLEIWSKMLLFHLWRIVSLFKYVRKDGTITGKERRTGGTGKRKGLEEKGSRRRCRSNASETRLDELGLARPLEVECRAPSTNECRELSSVC